MKRIVCIVILVSMALHCTSRLGVISYLYSKRHNIAYSVGFISEVPIAMCNADNSSKTAPLLIKDQSDSDKSLPAPAFQVREIHLFFEDFPNNISTALPGMCVVHHTERPARLYSSPDRPIFHPPCEA